MVITALNPLTDNLERTWLAQSYSGGATSVEVKNNSNIANNNRIMVGEMGQEKTEIVTAGAPNANGTTLPVGATLFSHEANTPITVLKFDQVKFYRSTNGINGSYSLLATVSLDVDNANLETTYDDTSATTGYYYKVSMFNSITLVESALGDALPAITGWDVNQVGYTIDQIYREIADPNEQFLSRAELIGYFNDVNSDLKIDVAKPFRFLYTRQVLDRTANLNYLSLPVDSLGRQKVWKFDRLDYRFYDASTNPVTDTTNTVKMEDLEYFRNRYNNNLIDSTTVDDTIQAAALNDITNVIDYFPASQTTSTYGCFYLYYWKDFNRIQTEGDYFETYSPHIYKLFALMKYYLKRSVTEPAYMKLAQNYQAMYANEAASYKKHDRRDRGTSRRIRRENQFSRRYQR